LSLEEEVKKMMMDEVLGRRTNGVCSSSVFEKEVEGIKVN